uniref:Uncharacterized protein n=1 Tax=Glossina austeni TaxID=7395 RepID=A0A1A9VJ96_GLOAU
MTFHFQILSGRPRPDTVAVHIVLGRNVDVQILEGGGNVMVTFGESSPESGSLAAYETSHSERVNRVESGLPATYETTRSERVNLESQRYKSADTTLHQQGADATPDDTAPILEQQSSSPQQQMIVTTSRTTSQQRQQFPQQHQKQQQVSTEISTQVSSNIQWMPTYSDVNIVTPLQPYNNHNNNITKTTVNSTTTTTTTIITRPTNRMLPTQQRQYTQQNANNNFNGRSSVGTGHLASVVSPTIAVVEKRIAGNLKRTDNENKISYETDFKQILSHSPIPSSVKGYINNSSNQLQQQSALHNHPSLQANFIKHTLPSPTPPPILAYEITDLIKKATNKVSERQQQRRKTLDYVTNNMVNECLTRDSKFPAEDDVMDADDLNQNHHAKSHNLGEEEKDDTFTLKMSSSVDTNDDLSLDSTEEAVKAKISEIWDHLTNEDCIGSLATANTLEAHLNACQSGFADLEASKISSQASNPELTQIIQQTHTQQYQSSNPNTTAQYILTQQQQTQQATRETVGILMRCCDDQQ